MAPTTTKTQWWTYSILGIIIGILALILILGQCNKPKPSVETLYKTDTIYQDRERLVMVKDTITVTKTVPPKRVEVYLHDTIWGTVGIPGKTDTLWKHPVYLSSNLLEATLTKDTLSLTFGDSSNAVRRIWPMFYDKYRYNWNGRDLQAFDLKKPPKTTEKFSLKNLTTSANWYTTYNTSGGFRTWVDGSINYKSFGLYGYLSAQTFPRPYTDAGLGIKVRIK